MKNAFLLAMLLSLVACTTPAPTLDTSADAEATFDGLYPVENAIADSAWARPGVDITEYDKVMLVSVGVQYRPGGESGGGLVTRRSGDYFEVTEAQKADFEGILMEAFESELERAESFTLVTEPGPGVLLLVGGVLDVVSYIPPESVGVRDRVFLRDVGEATLLIELHDSITGTTLLRAVDRRAAGDDARFNESNRVTNRAEARRLASIWAGLLRRRLDAILAPEAGAS